MANSVDPDQTALGAVCSVFRSSSLFTWVKVQNFENPEL